MRKVKEKSRRISALVLAVMLSIALLPAGAFAYDLQENRYPGK